MRYYRRRSEDPDRPYGRGPSTSFFETDDAGVIVRQVEIYEDGPVLRYSTAAPEDAHGRLSETPIEVDEWEPFIIPAEAFEQLWSITSRWLPS